jgi:ESCRT-I complex subunit VPS28
MFSLDEEAKLYSTNAEREKYETQATLFGIIVALDYLERAYIRDSVSAIECVSFLLGPRTRRYFTEYSC